jgi:putative oxidoreductase
MPADKPAAADMINPAPEPTGSLAGSATGKRDRVSAFLRVFARTILAAAFLYMGANKVQDPISFLKLVDQYDLTSNSLILNVIAAALPWFEVFCGLLLLTGVAVRGTALVVLCMLLPFSIVVFKRALVMASTHGIAFCSVQFDCGCGGGEIIICRKLMENAGLMLVSIWLIFCPPQKLSLRYSLFGGQP